MRFLAFGVLCLFILNAQEPVRPPARALPSEVAKPAPPSDRKAFQAAQGEKDPSKRIAALEKFINDFPDNQLVPMARRAIIGTALKQDPNDAVRRTKVMAERLPPTQASSINGYLAAELVGEKKLLPEAEAAARRAIGQLEFAPFASQVRQEAAGNGNRVLSDDQIRIKYYALLGRLKESLGQALFDLGREGEARQAFDEALKENPSLSGPAMAMGDMYDRDGKVNEALDYYTHAFLAKPLPLQRERFREAWARAKGKAGGDDLWLNERYRKLFASPLRPAKYVKSGQRSDRVVLGEIYTGAGCGPCVAADLAFDAIMERYSRSDFAMIAYHEHIPRPDPMANQDTIARWKWQQGRGVPTYAIDGEPIGMGGGPRDGAAEIESLLREKIDKQLDAAPAARIELSTAHEGRAVSASVKVSSISQDSPDLVLNIVLVEKELTYSGENGIRFHPMVARAVETFALNREKARSESRRFDLAEVEANLIKHIDEFEKHDERHNKDGKFRFLERKTAIDPAHLAVVAFVQDAKTRQVLQAVYSEAKPRAAN